MKNFVFISPNFPVNYWKFCRELKNNGLRVMGIGDQPYDDLLPELRDSLHEYYKVNSLENYDEVYRAVAFFTFKYGRIDWLESNNEYWLERDAQLRTDFNITSGFKNDDIPFMKYKSKMKEFYHKAGLATARYHLVEDIEGCRAFIEEVGYPVVVKPDNGVGAESTYRLKTDEDLVDFMGRKNPAVPYIMEEYVTAEVTTYDAIINSKGEAIWEGSNVTVSNLMDVVNDNGNSLYYLNKEIPADVKKAGLATVASFGVKSRFVHFEFFRLLQDQEGLGKKDDIMALEVNMRPSGGFSPDMINFAHSTDVYKIWADMIAFDKSTKPKGESNHCGFAGLRDEKNFVMSHEAIMEKYGSHIRMVDRIPEALSGAMGNQMYLATFATEEELMAFYEDITREK